jgi:hypothetical protein
VAGLRAQLRVAPTQTTWLQARNVSVFRVPSHTSFSDRVATHYLQPLADGPAPGSDTPTVMAVCAYPPAFFINTTLQFMKAHRYTPGTPKTQDHFLPAEIELIENFRTCSVAEIVQLSPARQSDLEAIFLRAADSTFPHFPRLRNEPNVIRLCFFPTSTLHANANLMAFEGFGQYVLDFQRENSAADVYAFFHWLNRKEHCFFIPPYYWEEWGMPRPRDFAVFHDQFLVEYHPDLQLCIEARFGQKGWRWPFADLDSFRRRLNHPQRKWSPDTLFAFYDSIEWAREEASAHLTAIRKRWPAPPLELIGEERTYALIDDLLANIPKSGNRDRLNQLASLARTAIDQTEPDQRKRLRLELEKYRKEV